jgi:hypothetical protein
MQLQISVDSLPFVQGPERLDWPFASDIRLTANETWRLDLKNFGASLPWLTTKGQA